MLVAGRRYDTGELVTVRTDGPRIASIEQIPTPGALAAADRPKRDLPWISPGFVDLQVNGYRGHEFNAPDLTVEQVAVVCRAMDRDGVTTFAPTSTTHSLERQCQALRTLAQACDSDHQLASRMPVFHLEGPFLSPADGPRGAHPLEHTRPPNWHEFEQLQGAAGGRIKIVTMSPEYEGSARFIERLVAAGVMVSIGHTQADTSQLAAAVSAGARLSTHLGNGAHGQIRRHPNYIWDQLADDHLVASLIVDGHHLPPAVVKSFVRAKTPDRCILVSDLVGMAGMPAGRYPNTSIGDIEILDNGCIVVGGQRQYLAGAGFPITYGIANIMRFARVDVRTAVDMASRWPARLLEFPVAQGLTVGSPADLVLFQLPVEVTGPIAVSATIKDGQLVHGSLPPVHAPTAA